jgi:hypothetical protein
MLFGGLTGPLIGGFILALYDYLHFRRLGDEFADVSNLLFFPFMALVLSGLPALLVGFLGGPWLVRAGRRTLTRTSIGAGMGLAAVLLAVLVIALRAPSVRLFEVFAEFKETYPAGLIAGVIIGFVFPVRWASTELINS